MGSGVAEFGRRSVETSWSISRHWELRLGEGERFPRESYGPRTFLPGVKFSWPGPGEILFVVDSKEIFSLDASDESFLAGVSSASFALMTWLVGEIEIESPPNDDRSLAA